MKTTFSQRPRVFHGRSHELGWHRLPACAVRRLAGRNGCEVVLAKVGWNPKTTPAISPGQWPGGTGESPVPPIGWEISRLARAVQCGRPEHVGPTQAFSLSKLASTSGSRTSTQRPSICKPAMRWPAAIIAVSASVSSYSPRGDFCRRAVNSKTPGRKM